MLDIETAPNKGYFWGLWDQNIAINQIVEPGYTLCWAAKWYGQRDILFDSINESKPATMIRKIHTLLDEADAVVHFNGRKFDVPTLNREFLMLGLAPPSQYRQIDLLKVTRSEFRFASNKLDYVVQQLALGGKVTHKGMDLWKGCMNGNAKDWAVMKRYNIMDVKLLERYYKKVLPWIKNHPNWGVYLDGDRPTCRNCGSTKVKKNGTERTNTLTYQRYRCASCGTPVRDRERLAPAREGLTV